MTNALWVAGGPMIPDIYNSQIGSVQGIEWTSTWTEEDQAKWEAFDKEHREQIRRAIKPGKGKKKMKTLKPLGTGLFGSRRSQKIIRSTKAADKTRKVQPKNTPDTKTSRRVRKLTNDFKAFNEPQSDTLNVAQQIMMVGSWLGFQERIARGQKAEEIGMQFEQMLAHPETSIYAHPIA